jgi:hypothetical protein
VKTLEKINTMIIRSMREISKGLGNVEKFIKNMYAFIERDGWKEGQKRIEEREEQDDEDDEKN